MGEKGNHTTEQLNFTPKPLQTPHCDSHEAMIHFFLECLIFVTASSCGVGRVGRINRLTTVVTKCKQDQLAEMNFVVFNIGDTFKVRLQKQLLRTFEMNVCGSILNVRSRKNAAVGESLSLKSTGKVSMRQQAMCLGRPGHQTLSCLFTWHGAKIKMGWSGLQMEVWRESSLKKRKVSPGQALITRSCRGLGKKWETLAKSGRITSLLSANWMQSSFVGPR